MALSNTVVADVFGVLVKHNRVPRLKQHINSVFLAHLARGKRPPIGLRWLFEENPFFTYIAGVACRVPYPDPTKLEDPQEFRRDEIVPLQYTKPTSWIFRRDPYVRTKGRPSAVTYTPVWHLVGEYLQASLRRKG